MTLVALSASYGAGGTKIGPMLAHELGVAFLDRAIPLQVAEHLEITPQAAAARDEQVPGGLLDRLLSGFIGSDTGAPTTVPVDVVSDDRFRDATEAVLRRQADTGEGVILGRMGMVLLREHAGALRVRLDGPPERRIAQAMSLEDLDRATAERGLRSADRMHTQYARHFYGVDLGDPHLYHLVIDSTAIPLGTCVEVIAAAARSLTEVAAR